MRRIALVAASLAALTAGAHAQPIPGGPTPGAPTPGAKPNANPCSDEVSASLQKLRKSSWFRMTSDMITENGPTTMQVDYVLPDRMHQKVTNKLTNKASEVILVGNEAWSRQGEGSWTALKANIAAEPQTQMQETVLQQQADVGAYTCKGQTKFEDHDVMSYRLESEPGKSGGEKNQTYRMFYVDALTGLPVGNALLVPGHDKKPIFKTIYSFPLDLKIEPPKDVAPPQPASTSPAAPSAPGAATPSTPSSAK
jgi:hypothetical protein